MRVNAAISHVSRHARLFVLPAPRRLVGASVDQAARHRAARFGTPGTAPQAARPFAASADTLEPMAARDDEKATAPVRPGQAIAALDETAASDPSEGVATNLRSGEPPDRVSALPAEIGRFKITGRLGQGGMGLVLLATDPLLGRSVAIKILHGDRAAEASAKQRMLREAQGMAQLSHENVIVVHEVGMHADRVYLAMEYVVGGTLTRWQAGRDWREILDVYVRAGRGLQAAHEAGLVHRDFKPDNVLVGDDGRVRVTDFGLVATANEPPETGPGATAAGRGDLELAVRLTETGVIVGTPRFMAPEQHRGEAVDARADQFSFCVALYQALFGVPPFAGAAYAELVDNVLAGRVTAAPADSKVPASVREALLRGLRPDLAERHASMNELLALLSIREPIVARRRWPLAVGGAVVVVAGVVALVAARSGHRDGMPPVASSPSSAAKTQPPPAPPAPPVVEGAASALDVTRLQPAMQAFDGALVDLAKGRPDAAAHGFRDAYASMQVPQLLFDLGISLTMQGKRDGDPRAYAGAVDAFTRYATIDPMAPGIDEMIRTIELEIERLEQAHPGTTGPTHAAPSPAMTRLAIPVVRGFALVLSEPPGATIYVDDQSKGPFGVTPWSGTLDGEHRILIAKRGFHVLDHPISADPSKGLVLQVTLAPESEE